MPDLQIKDGKVVYLDDSSPANTIYKLPTADGTTAQVIKTDGGGNLSFGDVSGTISISGSYGNSIIVNSDEDGGVSSDILHTDVANSRVGINDTTPSYTLDVNGTFRTTGNSILGDASGDSVTINAATIALANVAAGTDNTVLVYNGSSVVTDEIDSRVWGSTLVDGSGSSNNITKWSDSNTVTNSLITDDGSTVTVGGNFTVTGTTTTVNTTNTTITDNLLELNSGASSNSNDSGIIIERGSTGDNGLFIWDESADKFALGTTTGTASSTGDITYADAGLQLSTLNISDDLVFGNRTTTDGHIQLYNGSLSTGYAIGVEPSTTYYRSGSLHRWYIATLADGGTSDYMQLSTTALTVNAGLNVSGDAAFDTDTLFVDVSADRVGIGTTSPDSLLHVSDANIRAADNNAKITIESAGFSWFQFLGDDTAQQGILWGDAASVNRGRIYYEHSDDSMSFGTDGTIRAVIDGTGNVGIGTQSPSSLLHVGSLVDTSTPATYSGTLRVSGATQTTLEAVGGIELPVAANGYGIKIQALSASGSALAFARRNSSASWTESMRIDTSGNVGIGTSSPQGHLHINTESAEATEVYIDGESNQQKSIQLRHYDASEVSGTGRNTFYLKTKAADKVTLGGYDNSSSEFEVVTFQENGYVGIGTTSPNHKLSVYGDSDGNRTEIGIDNLDQRLVLGAYYELGVAQYSTIQATNNLETSATNLVLQPDGGNVGIGMAPIAQKLEVAGAIKGAAGANSGDAFLIGNDSKLVDIDIANVGGLYGTSTTTEGGLKLGSGGPTLYGKSSNLGIGTTSPSDTLHVVGIGRITTAVITPLVKSGSASGNVVLQGGNSGGANIELYGESHATVANDAYYDADVHNFRSASAATAYATFAAAEIDFTRTLNMNNYPITGVGSLTINDPGPNEGIAFGGGSGWSIYESPDDLTTNSAGNLQFVDSGSRIFTLKTNGTAQFTGNRIDISDNTDQNLGVGFAAMDALTSGIQNTGAGLYALSGVTSGNSNTAFGYQAGNDITTQSNNTLMGRYAGVNTIGNNNTFIGQSSGFGVNTSSTGGTNVGIGYESLKSYTTGASNVAVGGDTLEVLTTGYNNVAIGKSSGVSVTDGFRNTLVGSESGLNLTTGDYNTLIGRAAGYDQTTASHNTAVGASAGENMTSVGNVYVGSQSGLNATSGVNTAVGYQTLEQCTTGTLNTAIGYRAMDTLTTASNHTAVGTYAGLGSNPSNSSGNVWVGYDAGNGPIGTCTGVANIGIGAQAMTSHTTSSAVTCIGFQSGLYLQTANDSVGIGRNTFEGEAARLVTGNSNVAIGPYAMRRAKSGVGNISMGRSALHGPSGTGTTGSYNVSLGYESGFDVSSGSYNVMTGFRAGFNITTGGLNTALGTEALYSATSAGSNVAVGRQALYSLTDGVNNTAIGRNSLDSTTTGDYNVAVGYQALDANITGGAKTAVGYQALQNDTGASLSTAVGYQALNSQTTGLYNVAIGHSAGLAVTTSNDNVFIGTTTGIATTGASNTMVGFQAGYDQTSGANNLLLGRYAGRSTSPSGTITTGSNIVCLGDNSITALYCADTTISSSDARDKTDVEDFSAGLDFVNKLRPVTYRWDKRSRYITKENDDILSITPDGTHKEARQHLGFLAQEVEEIEKEFGYSQTKDSQLVVNTNEDETAMGIKYERLVPVLVNAIKELSAEIENLKSQLNQS